MATGESNPISQRILELALQRGLMTQAAFDEVRRLDGDPCDQAIERQLLSAADIDLLKPLADPTNFLPGYEFTDLIGQGASGAVYRATQTALQRDVALKVLKSASLGDSTITARSQLEARIGASLQHPAIATVYDYGVHQQRIYLAMEFIAGESLEETIERSGPIEPHEALRIARQVSTALRYANTQGVVHRDVKPANIMVTDDTADISNLADNKAIKVTDFGLAFNADSTDSTRLTVDGSTLGSPSYVAPEQLESTNVDQRADIYALGASLFHMVTGAAPFAGRSALRAIAQKMQGSDEWLQSLDKTLPTDVRDLIVRMTRSDPADRLPNYEELETRIDEILNPEAPTGTTSRANQMEEPARPDAISRREPTQQKQRTIRWLLLSGIAALIAVGIVSAVLFFNQDQSPPPARIEVVRGRSQPLFLGDGLPEGRQQAGSLWTNGLDDESGSVLQGRAGWFRFALPPELQSNGYFGFRIEVALKEGTTSDICFGFDSSGHCHVVRLANGMAKLGRGVVSDEDEFAVDPPSAKTGQSTSNTFQASENYEPHSLPNKQCKVYIERQPTGWFVNIDGKPLGAATGREGDDKWIYIRVSAGTVFFNDIAMESLKPVEPDAESK